jgi:hypothetical protein
MGSPVKRYVQDSLGAVAVTQVPVEKSSESNEVIKLWCKAILPDRHFIKGNLPT